MKKIYLAAILLAFTAISGCSKQHQTCYTCKCVSASVLYSNDVCTDGNPADQLPDHDANNILHWDCKEK